MSTTLQGLIVGTLSVRYDRGVMTNKPRDLGVEDIPEETPEGGRIRGAGTHFVSAEAERLNRERSREEDRLRREFTRAFVKAPFKGTFILPKRGAGRAFLAAITPPIRSDVTAFVSEYSLGVLEQAPEEMREWATRIGKQLETLPYGGGTEVAMEGLDALTSLASCPLFTEESRTALLSLITDAKLSQVPRVEFKRRLSALVVNVGKTTVQPRQPKRSPITKS